MKDLTIDEIRSKCTEEELNILSLYLKRCKQKDICTALNISRGKIDYIVSKYSLNRFRDRKNFQCCNIDSEDSRFWYFIGLFASDGNLYNCSGTDVIQFTLDDRDALEDIKSILQFTGNIYQYIKGGKIRYYIKISDSKLISVVRHIFNCDCYNKTFTLQFPKIDSQDKLKMFLRGFFDGDGSFAKAKNPNYYNFKLYCASKDFIKSLYDVLSSIIDNIHLYENAYIEVDSYRQSYILYKYLYSIHPEIGIRRKTERAMQHIHQYELKI